MTRADVIVKNMMKNFGEKYLTDREITSLDQVSFDRFNFVEKLNVVPLSYRDREIIEEQNLLDSDSEDIINIDNPVLLQNSDGQANWFVVSLIDLAKYMNREVEDLLDNLDFNQNSFKLNGELKKDRIVTLENSSEFLVSRESINRKSVENLKDIVTVFTDKAREVIEDKASSWLNFTIFELLRNSEEEVRKLIDREVIGRLVLTEDRHSYRDSRNNSIVLASSEEVSRLLDEEEFNRFEIANKIIETAKELESGVERGINNDIVR